MSPLILEEYVVGEEYSVEAFTFQSENLIMGITQKRTTGKPFFVEMSHVHPASAIPFEIEDALKETTQKLLDSCGTEIGASHTELVYSQERGPVVIETHSRVPGDYIAWLVEMTSDFDLYQETILAVHQNVPFVNRESEAVGGVFFFLLPPGIFIDTNLPDVCKAEGIEHYEFSLQKGAEIHRVTNSWGRHGHLRFVSENREAFEIKRKRLEQALWFGIKTEHGERMYNPMI